MIEVAGDFNSMERVREVIVTTSVEACRDPRDDKFLALAVDGRADYLVSSDRDLLDMEGFDGIPIVTPRDFLGC